MKSFTVHVDDRLLDAAHRKAFRENTTLDTMIRSWMEDYAGDERIEETPEERKARVDRAMATIEELRKYIDTSGPKPTRDEMNAR